MVLSITGSTIGWAIAAGAAVGVCAGAWYWSKHRKTTGSSLFSFADLISSQVVMDTLNGRQLAAWFRQNASAAKGTPAFFLAKPCAQVVKMFGLDAIPQELDVAHNLLQVVVDKEKMLPVAMRMVSFETMDAELEKAFNGKDFILVSSDT